MWDAGAGFFGGAAQFAYSIKPLGQPTRPTARFDATISGSDLAAFTDTEKLAGVRFGGAASGHILIEWPLGRGAERTGSGNFCGGASTGRDARWRVPRFEAPRATAASGDPSLPAAAGAPADRRRADVPVRSRKGGIHIGALQHRADARDVPGPDGLGLAGPHRVSRRQPRLAGKRRGAGGDHDRLRREHRSRGVRRPRRVRRRDDGSLQGGRVSKATSRGTDLWAWDTLWGSGTAHIVVENKYVDVRNGVIRLDGSEIRADGLFSLGFPRDDDGQEIDARFRVARRDLNGLRHAFQIDEYPVSGLLSGEFHLEGDYQRPMGFGGLTIENGTAYGEPLQKVEASLRFVGTGIRLDGINIDTAAVGRSPVRRTSAGTRPTRSTRPAVVFPSSASPCSSFPRAPLSGLAEFTAQGNGTFDVPRNDFKIRVNDLFIGEEGVGQVSGIARAPRQGAERRSRRCVSAPRDHRHGTHRPDAAGRCRAHVPVPRQLARPVRPAVRASPVAVHDRRRQRVDSRRRRTGGLRPPARGRHGGLASTCASSTTRSRTRRPSASRSTSST